MGKQKDDLGTDPLALLYASALDKLKSGKSLDFDQDDLLDIYDYALSCDDMWVSNEIMDYALHAYPDFEDMLERKAMALLELNELEGAAAVAETLSGRSFIKRIINAALNWDADSWREGYQKLYKGLKPGDLYDYETNSLVNFALDYDSINHLAQVYKEFVPFCAYPETLISSIVMALFDDDAYEEALPLLNELTELEPFSVEHWVDLANYYINQVENFEEGANALDYALAIDPESEDALKLKADLLVKKEATEAEFFEHAEQMEAAGLTEAAAMFKATALLNKGEYKKAAEIILGKVDNTQNALGIYLLLLTIVSDVEVREKIRKDFTAFVKNCGEAQLETWIGMLTEGGQQQDAFSFYPLYQALRTTDKEIGEESFSRLLAWEFVRNNYANVVAMYEDRIKVSAVNPYDVLTFVLACEMEHVHAREIPGLLKMCVAQLHEHHSIVNTQDIMLLSGISHIAAQLISHHEKENGGDGKKAGSSGKRAGSK